MKRYDLPEKGITINYSVHVGYAYATTNIVQDERDFILYCSRKSGVGKPTYLKSKHYKYLWSAIRASRKWIHDEIGAKVKEAEEN